MTINRLRAGSRWIDREPFLSRFGNWARESDLFQWFIIAGGAFALSVLVAVLAQWVVGL